MWTSCRYGAGFDDQIVERGIYDADDIGSVLLPATCCASLMSECKGDAHVDADCDVLGEERQACQVPR
jgi:hypothetical protein